MGNKLHKLDIEIHSRVHIDKNDKCFYFLEKESEGYSKSDANSLIYNFKKPLNRKGRPEWRYKTKAIKEISKMMQDVKYPDNCVIVPAPTSKPRDSEQFDDRIDQVVDSLKERQNVNIQKILDVSEVQQPAHEGGSRNIKEIQAYTICSELKYTNNNTTVIIVDDVLTTGAHFKAWKELILEKHPNIKEVIGVFFALHIWPELDFEDISDIYFD